MFAGHFGVGFAAKRFAPSVGLGVLFLAAQLIDLLWPTFLLLGWERVAIAPGVTAVTPLDFQHYPYSHSLPATLLVEMPIFIGGCWLYARATRARDAVGRWAFVGLVAFLLLIQAANLAGGPPPSVDAIAWAGHAQWLIVLWAFWVDRHREAVA